jgi:peptide deformylase
MIRPIRLYGDPLLRRPARSVSAFDDDLRTLADDLVDTMIAADGLGLAAPQIGVPSRIFVVASAADPERHPRGEEEPEPTLEEQRQRALVFVNPVLELGEGRQVGIEGCLSLPGLYHEEVERHALVRVRHQDLTGAWHARAAGGRFAVVLQHEADHLDGVLFFDRLPEAQRFAFMDEHRAELAQMQRDARAALRREPHAHSRAGGG